MGFRFGWFSTGRDETARQLLEVVVRQISKGFIPGEVGYVFYNRMRGEAVESDQFIEWVESLGIPLILLSSNDFEPSLRQKNRETWRIRYHQEVEKRVRDCPVDLVVLACLSSHAFILAVVADIFRTKGGEGLLNAAEQERPDWLISCGADPALYSEEIPKLQRVTEENRPTLIQESETFRKQVRGVRIGTLG